jgi:hypothetical protein
VEISTAANSNDNGRADCNPGERATGGGVELEGGNAARIFYFEPGGIPVGDPPTGWSSSWFAEVTSLVRVYAVCAS